MGKYTMKIAQHKSKKWKPKRDKTRTKTTPHHAISQYHQQQQKQNGTELIEKQILKNKLFNNKNQNQEKAATMAKIFYATIPVLIF